MIFALLAACVGSGSPADKASDTSATSPNEAPAAPLLAITPAEPGTDDPLVAVVQGGAADPDGDTVTFAYAWFRDSVDAGVATDTVDPSETTKGETWRVVVTPSDGTLEGEPAIADVTVVNTAPTLSVALPASATTTDTVTATPTAEDADGDAVAVTWSWTRDGADTAISEPTLPPGTHLRGETWVVTGVPHDGEVEGEPATAELIVANVVPALAEVWLDPVAPTLLDTITATFGAAADADGDVVTVDLSWEVDGVEVATDTVDADAPATLAGLFAKGQTVRVVATPFDGYEHGIPVEASVVVVNAAPSATGATISPSPLTAADTAICTGSGWSDPDGDVEGWQVSWTVNGSVVSTDPTLAGAFARGDTVGCTLVPDDGEGTGDPVVAADVTVDNSPPTCTALSLSIGPDPATVADTLGITAETSTGCADGDGDTLVRVYDWQVGGTSVGTGATLAGAFDRGQSVTLTGGWSDGFVTAATVTSNAVLIVNQAPTVESITLTPSPAYTDDDLAVLAVTSDLEGDPVGLAYAWTVDGLAVGSGSNLGSTAFAKGQTVALTVTPSDGSDSGTPVSTSAVIANSAPSAPSVAVAPASPADDDSLVCSVTAAATDADGDTLAYTFAWTVGGIPYGSTTTTTFPGDTISAASTALGQTWACSVTASDGSASASGSDSVVVGCDLDGDGYDDTSCGGDDCDDADAAQNPGATEVCDGSVDEDCDGLVDDADPSLSGTTWYPDVDGDGYGDADGGVSACSRPTGHLSTGDDCDDGNASIRPGASEKCDNADVDEDCDGLADDADTSATGKSNQRPDADGDGYGDEFASSVNACPGLAGHAANGSDCDDTNSDVSPGAEELCDDGVDNNCDEASYPCGVEGEGDEDDAWFAIEASSTGFGYDLALADLNGDGAQDIVVVNFTYDRIQAWYGTFPQETVTESDDDVRWTLSAEWGMEVADAGDTNGDGYDDVVVLTEAGATYAYLLEGGPALTDTTVSSSSALQFFNNYGQVEGAGDFDDDGYDDVLVADNGLSSASETDRLSLYLGDATGLSTAPDATWTGTGGYLGYDLLGQHDWDGDGIDDVVMSAYGSGTLGGVYFLAGDANPVGSALVAGTDTWIELTDILPRVDHVGDLNGDGYADLFVANVYEDTGWFFTGSPTAGLDTDDAFFELEATMVASGDTDGDGAEELYVGSADYVRGYALPLSSAALPTEQSEISIETYYPNYVSALTAGEDLDGDGLGDLFFGGYNGAVADGVYVYTGGSP